MGNAAPHLLIFIIVLLLLLYGYEIFNFSLSIDEELSGSGYVTGWKGAIAQGRWGMGTLIRAFPPLGHLPMLATVLFCAGLGVTAYVLARVLFRDYGSQWVFAGMFVASPLWPHVAAFNTFSWHAGIGCVLLTFALLLTLENSRLGHILAICFLAFAAGIYQSFYVWFFVLLCIRYLSVALKLAPVDSVETNQTFPWLRSGLIAVAGLVGYLAMQRILLFALSIEMNYVQGYMRLGDFSTAPKAAVARSFQRFWSVFSGADRIYLGYGRILVFLSLLGLLIVVGRLVWREPLRPSQRLLSGTILAGAIALAMSPIVVSAGTIPARALIAWIPISAFLAGVTLSQKGWFRKPLYAVLVIVLFVSIWVTVSLFYSDHLARQRDELLATRIMVRIDQILPQPPPSRTPFVVIGLGDAGEGGGFHRVEVFGASFFEQDGGNPWRVAAYLKVLGVETLEPHRLTEFPQHRPIIDAMPVWPAAGSVAIVDGLLVIKLKPLPRASRANAIIPGDGQNVSEQPHRQLV
jgi:hypothetical protein